MSDLEGSPKHTTCDCCHFPTLCVGRMLGPTPREAREMWLCTLCSYSLIGNAYVYGLGEYTVVRNIAWIGNAILAALKVKPEDLVRVLDDLEKRAEEDDSE